MKKKPGIVVLLGAMGVVGAVVFCSSGTATSASASPQQQMIAAHFAAMSTVTGPEEAEYVGASKCKKCHLAEHKSWEKLPHAKAFDALKPDNAVEAKTKAKLDPKKDYTKDAACVACHVQGFGKPGGYQMPADEAAAKKEEGLQNVGCENCHGPGGKYIAVHEEIMKSKKKYKNEEMVAAGTVTKPDKAVCVTCHNEKSPTFDASVPFDFDKMKAKGVHENQPLKQKE